MSAPNKYGPNLNQAQIVYVANDEGPGQYISGAALFTGPYRTFTALTAFVGNFTSDAVQGTLTGVSIPAGVTFGGPFNTIASTSGTGIARF